MDTDVDNILSLFHEQRLKNQKRFDKSFDEFVKKYESLSQQEISTCEVDLNNFSLYNENGYLKTMKQKKFGFVTKYCTRTPKTEKMLIRSGQKEIASENKKKLTKKKKTQLKSNRENDVTKPKNANSNIYSDSDSWEDILTDDFKNIRRKDKTRLEKERKKTQLKSYRKKEATTSENDDSNMCSDSDSWDDILAGDSKHIRKKDERRLKNDNSNKCGESDINSDILSDNFKDMCLKSLEEESHKIDSTTMKKDSSKSQFICNRITTNNSDSGLKLERGYSNISNKKLSNVTVKRTQLKASNKDECMVDCAKSTPILSLHNSMYGGDYATPKRRRFSTSTEDFRRIACLQSKKRLSHADIFESSDDNEFEEQFNKTSKTNYSASSKKSKRKKSLPKKHASISIDCLSSPTSHKNYSPFTVMSHLNKSPLQTVQIDDLMSPTINEEETFRNLMCLKKRKTIRGLKKTI